MNATVTGRDILANLRTVWCEFGPSVTARCLRVLVTGKTTTLLDAALRDAVLSPASKATLTRGAERLPGAPGLRRRARYVG